MVFTAFNLTTILAILLTTILLMFGVWVGVWWLREVVEHHMKRGMNQ